MDLKSIASKGAFTTEAWLLVGLVVAFVELGLPLELAWPVAIMYGVYVASRVAVKVCPKQEAPDA